MSLPPTGSFRRGDRRCDASPFFLCQAAGLDGKIGFLHCLTIDFPVFLQESGYWLRRHRDNALLDSREPLSYFVGVI